MPAQQPFFLVDVKPIFLWNNLKSSNWKKQLFQIGCCIYQVTIYSQKKKKLWPLAQDLSLKPIPKSSTHVSPFRFRPPWWPSMLTIVVSIALTTHVSFWRPLNHDEVLRFLTKMVRTVQWHFLYSVGQQTITLNLHLHVRCLEKVNTYSPNWRFNGDESHGGIRKNITLNSKNWSLHQLTTISVL